MKDVNNIDISTPKDDSWYEDSIHMPYWIHSTTKDPYPTLKKDITVDVAIIGGGIVGITSAYLLKENGLKVAIIEGNELCHGTTGYTTAKITSQHGLIYNKLKTNMGEERAQQYAASNEYAISFIEDTIKKENIACDFHRLPAYIYTLDPSYRDKLEQEAKIALSLGIKASFLEEIPSFFPVLGALCFENQAEFHPVKYLLALTKKISGDNSYIFEHSRAVEVQEEGRCVVTTAEGYKVSADKIIIASHFPCYDGLGLYFSRIYTEMSYVIAAKIKETFPKGMFINAEDPGRSIRSQATPQGELILFGGDHHKTGHGPDTKTHYENIYSFGKEHYNLEKVHYHWATQDCMTVDGIPYIGALSNKSTNIFVATGFGKWGMSNGTVASIILTDMARGIENSWSPVYDPSRFTPIPSAAKLLKENGSVAASLIKGKLTPVPNSADLEIGEGKILQGEQDRIGVYKDEEGKLHIVNATCTHLGCQLVWNNVEKTWDCPCHGSRFTIDGENLEGPAFLPLSKEQGIPNKIDPNIL